MKRYFGTVLKSFDGTPFMAPTGNMTPAIPESPGVMALPPQPIMRDITLYQACMEALGAALPGDAEKSGADRMKLYVLASKIHAAHAAGEPAEVDEEDLATLKERLNKVLSGFAMGAAFRLLDTDYVKQQPAPAASITKARKRKNG